MTPRSAMLALIGGAFGLVLLQKLMKHHDPGKATPLFVPQEDTDTPGVSLRPITPQVSRPTLVQGDPVTLFPGQPYHVTLVTHRLANAASVSQVIGEAQKRGFTNLSVSKDKPAGWPGTATGDYYVSGLYSGPMKTQSRSEGNIAGSVDVVEVWMG